MAKSNFIVRGGADFSRIHQEVNKTQKQLTGFQGKMNKTFSGIASGMGLGFAQLGKAMLIGLAIRELYKFGKASIQVASDLKEVQNVVDVTFGSMSGEINDFASESIKQFGLSELSAKKYASTMGAMLKSSGISGSGAKDMSIDLAKLSADMASFYNLDNDEAFSKIMSGMSGMTMPLKELGINMNIANLEAFAMAQGISKSWQEMNQAEQTMTRYQYLLSVTADSQGDFARTSGTWANQTKILKEQWKEFMGLIGTALIEIVLPIVKGLNFLLGVLIDITKEIGKIFTLITGKKATVTSNNNIASSAGDAADNEEDLADGIDKAGKAAKKALAPFDELNILQNNMNDGGGSGGLGGIVPSSKGELNTTMETTVVDDGFGNTKTKANAFFIWFADKWNGLKQMFAVPLLVPAPIFASLPSPVYNPNWGLTPPMPVPVFQPIPSPVYQPQWGLEVPQIPIPLFPAIEHGNYDRSLESIKSKHAETARAMETESANVSGRITQGLVVASSMIEANYNTHRANMGEIAVAISAVMIANTNQWLVTIGTNINNTITTTQNNMQLWGKNLGSIAIETAKSFAANIAEGLRVTAENTVTFAKKHLENLKAWGSGVLATAGETARGFASNMASGFRSTWDNFKSLMSSMGEKVSGWWSENKGMVIKTAIVGAVIAGGIGLALAVPAAIPYMAGALGGLSAIPALAKGGITNGPTMAMVGDNPGGREVVSPLGDLMTMITQAVSTTSNNINGDMTVIVKIGEDTITEKIVKDINRKSRISGKTIITV